MSRKRAITTFLPRKFMITRLSIAFEDFLGSSIASQVMPPCFKYCPPFHLYNFNNKKINITMYALSKVVFGDYTVSHTRGWSVMLYNRPLIFMEKYPWRWMFVYQKRYLTCSYFGFHIFQTTWFQFLLLQFWISPKVHDRGASEKLELWSYSLNSHILFNEEF